MYNPLGSMTRWAAALMIAGALVSLAKLGYATSAATPAGVASLAGYTESWLAPLRFKGLTVPAQLP
jgi:hypothetical protein